MAQWILPVELENGPKIGDQDLHYGVELIEDDDLATLKTAVNAFLLALEATTYPVALLDITVQAHTYSGVPKDRYLATITFAAFGQVP